MIRFSQCVEGSDGYPFQRNCLKKNVEYLEISNDTVGLENEVLGWT